MEECNELYQKGDLKMNTEKWIVNTTWAQAYSFTDSDEKAAAKLKEAEEYEKKISRFVRQPRNKLSRQSGILGSASRTPPLSKI